MGVYIIAYTTVPADLYAHKGKPGDEAIINQGEEYTLVHMITSVVLTFLRSSVSTAQ